MVAGEDSGTLTAFLFAVDICFIMATVLRFTQAKFGENTKKSEFTLIWY